jgi:glycosyltransferase involved in cell wall biosynthesis
MTLVDSRPARLAAPETVHGLTVLVPAYNEERGIERVIGWIRDALLPAGLAYEVLVIDDGSVDRTAELAERAGARVLRHRGNRGYGENGTTGSLKIS